MSKATVTLRAEALSFLSPGDEAGFFQRLEQLSDVATRKGESDCILIDVVADRLNADQLRELIALFHRYDIDMRQLAVFENRSHRNWLRNQRAYWHDAMYKRTHSVPAA